MNIPNNFKFRFGDEPEYLHGAMKSGEDTWTISWDNEFSAITDIMWYTCSSEEIQGFVVEQDGWIIEEETK